MHEKLDLWNLSVNFDEFKSFTKSGSPEKFSWFENLGRFDPKGPEKSCSRKVDLEQNHLTEIKNTTIVKLSIFDSK